MAGETNSYESTVFENGAKIDDKCVHCVDGSVKVYDSNDDREWVEPCSRCNPKAYYEWVKG